MTQHRLWKVLNSRGFVCSKCSTRLVVTLGPAWGRWVAHLVRLLVASYFVCEFLLDFEVKWYVRLPVFLVGPVLLSALFRYGYLHPYGGDWVDVIRPAEDDTGRSGS